jgi:hypothetical protein
MTTNRARAYARVIALTDEMGAAKLHPDEQQAIRDAADALLFTVDVASDREAVELIRRLDATMDRLVDAGRLTETTADEIVEAVERCGPQTEPLQLPAAAV